MHNELNSDEGWLRTPDSNGDSFHGTWEYYEGGWKTDNYLTANELGSTNRK